MNPPTESGLKRSQKYRFSGTELNRISLKKVYLFMLSLYVILIYELNLFLIMYNFELIKSMCMQFLQDSRYINFIFIISLLHFSREFV